MRPWEKILAVVVILTLILAVGVAIWHFSNSPLNPPQPLPSTSATAVTSDPCHVNNVTYCTLNPDVTQATISRTICVSGWTSKVRPSTNYTNQLKAKQLAQYASMHVGDTNWNLKGTEEDHRVPLELGGAPSDPSNLSPEDHPGSFNKDGAENQFKRDVCALRVTLVVAQTVFIGQYLTAYPGYTSSG